MSEQEAKKPDLRNVKALQIDIAKILEQCPKAVSANIFYVITDGEIDIKGMEIINSEKTEQSK